MRFYEIEDIKYQYENPSNFVDSLYGTTISSDYMLFDEKRNKDSTIIAVYDLNVSSITHDGMEL